MRDGGGVVLVFGEERQLFSCKRGAWEDILCGFCGGNRGWKVGNVLVDARRGRSNVGVSEYERYPNRGEGGENLK